MVDSSGIHLGRTMPRPPHPIPHGSNIIDSRHIVHRHLVRTNSNHPTVAILHSTDSTSIYPNPTFPTIVPTGYTRYPNLSTYNSGNDSANNPMIVTYIPTASRPFSVRVIIVSNLNFQFGSYQLYPTFLGYNPIVPPSFVPWVSNLPRECTECSRVVNACMRWVQLMVPS